MLVFSSILLPNLNWCPCYRKCGTHERVFSQTLEHDNSKNEKRQSNRRSQKIGVSME